MKYMLLLLCLSLLKDSYAETDGDRILRQYEPYPFDEKPLAKHQKIWQEYLNSYKVPKGTFKTLTIADRQRNIEILERIHHAEPEWIEAHWLIASEKFQLASSFDNEKDLPVARKLLSEGRDLTRECLKVAPDNPLCKFTLASALGKIGTIDGVFASLRGAKEVEELWNDTKNSSYNHFFTERISMQGSVRYAFGIFYRLIPDWAILNWLFGVRGSLDLSVEYLEQAIAMDGPFPCSRLMLASSLLCRADGEQESTDYKRGMEQLTLIQTMPNLSVQSQICKKDALAMSAKPSLGCGYSTAKQQEQPEESNL